MKPFNFIKHVLSVVIVGFFLFIAFGTSENERQPSGNTADTSNNELNGNENTATNPFFFTNSDFKEIGDRNQLEMFALQSPDTLLICGKMVGELKYKIGDTVGEFLNKNLEGVNTINLKNVEIIEWSSDLRGDDTKLFLFTSGKLTKVQNE